MHYHFVWYEYLSNSFIILDKNSIYCVICAIEIIVIQFTHYFWNFTADTWIGASQPEKKHERKPLCPPPLVCLDTQNNHSSDALALDLATKGRNESSTSTPVGSSKFPSKGGLIRPIPSRLGSPFSPILGSGMVPSTLSSNNIFSKNHDSSAVNPLSLQLLGNGNSTTASKDSTKTRSFQKLSLNPG